MKECVDLRQGDMAHLLFRAAIRFRKYGLTVGLPFVKHLFHSYKHENAIVLMLNMAEELRNEPSLKLLAVLAYQFSNKSSEAIALLREVSRTSLTTSDYCALSEGFGVCGCYDEVYDIALEVMGLNLSDKVVDNLTTVPIEAAAAAAAAKSQNTTSCLNSPLTTQSVIDTASSKASAAAAVMAKLITNVVALQNANPDNSFSSTSS
uniref:Tetratricopeptide repeat protein 38 n=2 Tax=Lygus hesperus TaxID=30085 RepID=A0A0A9XE85_LYGHE